MAQHTRQLIALSEKLRDAVDLECDYDDQLLAMEVYAMALAKQYAELVFSSMASAEYFNIFTQGDGGFVWEVDDNTVCKSGYTAESFMESVS